MKEVYKKVDLFNGTRGEVPLYDVITEQRGGEEVEVLRIGWTGNLSYYTEALADYYKVDLDEINKVTDYLYTFLEKETFSFKEEDVCYQRTAWGVFKRMFRNLGISSEHHLDRFILGLVKDRVKKKTEQTQFASEEEKDDTHLVLRDYLHRLHQNPRDYF